MAQAGGRPLLLAQQSSGRLIHEMHSRTGRAIDRFIGIGQISRCLFGQPNLNVCAGSRTTDYDRGHAGYADAIARSGFDVPQPMRRSREEFPFECVGNPTLVTLSRAGAAIRFSQTLIIELLHVPAWGR